MPVDVDVDGVGTISFPDSMGEDEIKSVLDKQFQQHAQPDQSLGEKVLSTVPKAAYALNQGLVGSTEGVGKSIARLSDPGPRRTSYGQHVRDATLAGELQTTEGRAAGLLDAQRDIRRGQLMMPGEALAAGAKEASSEFKALRDATPGYEAPAKAAEMVGGVLPYVAEATIPIFGQALAVTHGGLSTGGAVWQQAYDHYKAQNLSDEDATKKADELGGKAGASNAILFAALPGAGAKAAEMLLGERLVGKPLAEATAKTLLAGGQAGSVMAADKALQLIDAKNTYRPDLTPEQAAKEIAEAFASGAAAGGVIHGATEIGKVPAKKAAQTAKDELQKVLQSQAATDQTPPATVIEGAGLQSETSAAGGKAGGETVLTADALLKNAPGETTYQEIASLTPEEAAKYIAENQKRGNALQYDSPLAGAKLGPEAIPELERLRDESHARSRDAFQKEMDAVKAGDEKAAAAAKTTQMGEQGRGIWYSGALEGARKKGGNYEAAIVAKPVTTAVPAPVEGKGGLASAVRARWTSATEEGTPHPLTESGAFSLAPLKDLWDKFTPAVKASAEAVKAIHGEALKLGKMSDYRRGVLHWVAKQQKSFQEAHEAQKEIQKIARTPVEDEALTNWLQAKGDPAVLAARAAATTDPKLKAGYEAALKLTPEQIAIAQNARATLDILAARGISNDVLNSFKDAYVTQIWDLKRGPTGGRGSRTLKERFRFSKASTFDTYFDGEQAGFKPKTKALSKLLPMYIHEMNSVIAARQLAKDLAKGTSSDGRPNVVMNGVGVPVTDATTGDKSTLVLPKVTGKKDVDTSDYKVLENQPALSGWKWAAKDESGNPIMLKADMALHPEVYNKLKNVLGRSAIREWYSTPTSALAGIPKAIVKALDVGQSEVKRTMLGFFAPFHQVQEGTHGAGHALAGHEANPFKVSKIDLNNPEQMDAAKHGLMLLPDRTSANQFMEGFKVSGLVSHLPKIGPAADWYSHYLFHEYIPGLKFDTYQGLLKSNMKVYEKDLASGKVTPEDVKVLTAESVNAAYGHLNYADLYRNPTIQHLLQLGLLAPDFLEARGRFALQAMKGLTGAKAGREQLKVVGALAFAQAATAFTIAQLTGGEWDWKRPFEFRHGNRTYTMRSVPEDIGSMVTDFRRFAYNRLNPITGKGPVQLASGVDWRGQKVTAGETLKELAQSPMPLMLRSFFGMGNTPLKWWEQTLSSVGIKISRYTPSSDVHDLVAQFKKNSGDPKLVAEYERDQHTTNPESDYKKLRDALAKDNFDEASKEYDKLLLSKKPDLVLKTMRPYSTERIAGTDAYAKHDKPFTGSRHYEEQFKKSLTSEEMDLYKKAQAERMETFKKFQQMLKQRKP